METTIKKITTRFFAQDSPAAVFLKEYVQGKITLPKTTQGIIGLPRAWRREIAKEKMSESQPNFLFLDLPEAPFDSTIPERFKMNVIIDALEDTTARDIPVFGVVRF